MTEFVIATSVRYRTHAALQVTPYSRFSLVGFETEILAPLGTLVPTAKTGGDCTPVVSNWQHTSTSPAAIQPSRLPALWQDKIDRLA